MKKIVFVLASVLSIGQAHAVGSNDLFSAGFSLLGQIGGAVIDKAMADSPEEIEAKRLKEKAALDAKFKESVAQIEARKDVMPLGKEKMVRMTAKQFGVADTMNNLSAQEELKKNAQTDAMFTAGGLAGAVGSAALSTPSAAIARADAAVAVGQPQAQSRNVLAQYDANNGVRPQVTFTPGQQANVANEMQGGLDKYKAQVNAEMDAAKSKDGFVVEQAVGLAKQDKERKVFVEFVNGKILTEKLRTAFKSAGFALADDKATAEVVYQFDGEYHVAAEPNRDGITEPLGAFFDAPHVIEAPQVKTGMLKSAAGGFLAVFSGGQIKPQATPETYRQQVLIVANRHFEGKDTRVASVSDRDSVILLPEAMIDEAMRKIQGAAGLEVRSATVKSETNTSS